MRRLSVELLGGFTARVGADTPLALPTRKARALLAYLAVPPGRFHSREKLTALLWGDRAEAQARQSFRQALAALRRAWGEGEPAVLLTRDEAVALNPDIVTVDVTEFEAALGTGGVEALGRASALYRGDLLEGLGVNEPAFEEWRVVERERLHELALEGLARLLGEQSRADALEPAVQTAQRMLALDPLQEAVHRTLMRLLVRQGRRAAALQQYQVCVGWLQRELGAEPEQDTRALYGEILRTAASPAARSDPALTAPAGAAAVMPLIGRGPELGQLRGALARMLDAGGRVVIVSGEAGIGKSRLIQEFTARAGADGAQVALARCYETEQALPLHVWIDALRGERAVLDPRASSRLGASASTQLVRVFPEMAGDGDSPMAAGAQPALLFDALVELIGALAAERPLVLAVEDLHWADALSARFLAFLGRRLHRLPVLVVGTMRPEELVDARLLGQAVKELRAEGRLDEIALGPLSQAESRALVRALQPGRRAGRSWETLARAIWGLGEGNPFVIIESVRALIDAPPAGEAPRPRVTDRVEDFVAARLDRLGETARQVVATAAVIGRDFPFALVARAGGAGERQTADAVEELVRRRILETAGGELAFCHDWFRHVAYERLLPALRTVIHAAVGAALEALHADRLDDVAGQLGHHYWQAADAGKAIPHLVRFAELSGQRYALDDAHTALQQAMALVDRLPTAERDRGRLDLALRQAFTLSLLGRHREVLDLLGTHAGHLVRAGDPALAAEYHFRLAMTHLYYSENAQARLAAEQALRDGERAQDPARIGKALHVLSLTCYSLGDPERGIAYAARAVSLLDRPGTQHYLGLAYNDLLLNHLVAGQLGEALAAAGQCEEVGRRTGDPRVEAYGSGYGAWAHALRGDAERALAAARRGIERSPERHASGLNTLFLGQAHLEQGDARAAIPLLQRAAETLGSIPIRSAESRARALLGEAYVVAGDPARGRELAARAVEAAREAGAPYFLGLAQRALGLALDAAGDVAGAEQDLTRALETFLACHAAFEAARIRLELVRVRAARGDLDGAREHLVTALGVFETAGAPRRVAQARELARALGLGDPGARVMTA
jgi:DNA-binding SARP family transcriptional activator